MDKNFRGNEYRTTIVCIDSYEDGVPVGRFYNPYCPEGKSFSSLTRFLVSMEEMLDEMHFPQSFLAKRSFADAAPVFVSETAENKNPVGALGTFLVKVLFRQDADWQGSVTWVEGGRDESFRGVLELILLMDGALNSMM